MNSGYWQVELDKEDRKKTAFISRKGLIEFKTLHFGLCNYIRTELQVPVVNVRLGLVMRHLDFVACEQQRRRPACTSVQSDQRLFFYPEIILYCRTLKTQHLLPFISLKRQLYVKFLCFDNVITRWLLQQTP